MDFETYPKFLVLLYYSVFQELHIEKVQIFEILTHFIGLENLIKFLFTLQNHRISGSYL